jgi:glycerophosphoryl diester phosphodiesterase
MEITGHRGAAAFYPDNSLAGIEYALKCGVDAVEVDLHLSKDDVWILHHDPQLPSSSLAIVNNGVTQKHRQIHYIRQLTWDKIQELSVEVRSEQKIEISANLPAASGKFCSLDQAVELWKRHHKTCPKVRSYLNLELKYDSKLGDRAYASRIHIANCFAQSVQQHAIADSILIQSFDWPLLRLIRQQLPNIAISPLYEGETLPFMRKQKYGSLHYPNWKRLQSFCQQIHAVGFSVNYRLLQLFPGWQKLRQESGSPWKVTAWTANKLMDYYWLQTLGVHTLITDDPDFFLALRDRRTLHPSTAPCRPGRLT